MNASGILNVTSVETRVVKVGGEDTPVINVKGYVRGRGQKQEDGSYSNPAIWVSFSAWPNSQAARFLENPKQFAKFIGTDGREHFPRIFVNGNIDVNRVYVNQAGQPGSEIQLTVHSVEAVDFGNNTAANAPAAPQNDDTPF